MGNLFCRTKRMRAIILGLDASGKTSMLYNMKLGEVISTIPTTGFNVEMLHVDGIEITCWDVGGRDKGRALWRHFFEGADGFIFMLDSSDRERLSEAIDEFISYVLNEEAAMNTVVMVVANKQDVEGAMSFQEIEDMLEKRSSYRDKTVFVMPCSAIDVKQVSETFSYFAHQVLLNQAGKAKRGFISSQERQSQMNKSNKSSPELALKTLLRNPVEYIKTYFQ